MCVVSIFHIRSALAFPYKSKTHIHAVLATGMKVKDVNSESLFAHAIEWFLSKYKLERNSIHFEGQSCVHFGKESHGHD